MLLPFIFCGTAVFNIVDLFLSGQQHNYLVIEKPPNLFQWESLCLDED
jgi:hypothetical protein